MNTQIFAARHKDREVLRHCSSGGAFTALSDVFLENGDAILCAGYNYDSHRMEYRIVFTAEERDTCRGSMYMQSYALDSWREAADWMKNNPDKQLVFFGLGCQAAGFISFCEALGLSGQITVVDIICHGVPSPMLWKQYAESLEKDGKLSEINMRDKRTGWSKSIGIAKLNGSEISLSKWRRAYSRRTMLRPCCSSCPYTTIERKSDITIGDFWHLEKSMPDFYDEIGTSLILTHTEKGKSVFAKAAEAMEIRESNAEDCWQMNLEVPTEHSEQRDAFWKDYRKKGIGFVMNRYGSISPFIKIKRKLNSILRSFGKPLQ